MLLTLPEDLIITWFANWPASTLASVLVTCKEVTQSQSPPPAARLPGCPPFPCLKRCLYASISTCHH
jgi:hypothetical protein